MKKLFKKKEKLVEGILTEQDEDKQIIIIRKMAKRLSTAKLKKGYRRLKYSKKDSDIKARDVMKAELLNRGIRIK